MESGKRTRADDIPSSSIPALQSVDIGPDVQHSQTLVPMLQSFFRGQLIIMHSLRELAHNRPIIPLEHFLWQLEVVPPSPPLIIISNASSDETAAPPDSPAGQTANPLDSPVGGIAALSDSSFGEVVAVTDSPV
ncbi:hypothetical protein JHK87_055536 [Glycine soja]|nr:hypothetical protein JHK87_055536 [Glycine soja]